MIDVLLGYVGARVLAPYRGTGQAIDRESICVECQGYSSGWDGELSSAPAAPHPGGGQAPALHFSPSTWFKFFEGRYQHGALARGFRPRIRVRVRGHTFEGPNDETGDAGG